MLEGVLPDVAATPSPRASDVRGRVLEAALDLFSEHGFDGTTVQQIADRLGVTKAALYYHFDSPKDEILYALVSPALEEFDALLDRYERLPPSPARRRRLIEDYVDYMLRQRRLLAYTLSDLAVVKHPAYANGDSHRRERFAAMVSGTDLDVRAQIRVAMAVRAVGGVIGSFPDADPEVLREVLLDGARLLLGPQAAGRGRRRALGAAEPSTATIRRRDAGA